MDTLTKYISSHAAYTGLLSLCIGVCISLSSCNLESSIELDLPEHEAQSVVECYLEPGQNYLLTLVRSSSYFDASQVEYVKGAEVSITVNNREIPLPMISIPVTDALPEIGVLGPLLGDTLFAYVSPEVIPEDYESTFELMIVEPDGNVLRSSTRIPAPVPIDTVEWEFNDDSLALVLTRFQDDPTEENYYRRVLRLGTNSTDPEQDFVVDDDLFNGQEIVFGSFYDYEKGDTLFSTVYHITSAYHDFLEINETAIEANLNPFVLPTEVFDNIEGGLGIFTGYTRDIETAIIP